MPLPDGPNEDMLSAPAPVFLIVSLPVPPMMVSPPTCKPAMLKVSSPSPPSMLSAPSPPVMVSLPAPALMLSLPLPVLIVSAKLLPVTFWVPPPPLMVTPASAVETLT